MFFIIRVIHISQNYFEFQVHFLSEVGGHDCEQATKFMLRRLMTDDLAVSFSYLGMRDKRAFKKLEICKVILCKHNYFSFAFIYFFNLFAF